MSSTKDDTVVQSQTFTADMLEMYPALNFVNTFLKDLGYDDKTLKMLEMSVEEVIVNVINYGYLEVFEDSGEHTFEIQLVNRGGRVIEITVLDQGKPFNPLTEGPGVDFNASAEEKDVGGLGIFLVKKIMDDVRYVRRGDYNIFTMVKRGPGASTS